MDSSYSLTVLCICGCAVFFNIAFILVFLKVPTRTPTSYKGFFLYAVLHHVLSAVIFSLITPRLFAIDYSFAFVAVGPGFQWSCAQVLVLIWTSNFMSLIVTVTNNFIFQYVQICKPTLVYIYSSPKTLLLLTSINVLIILNWTAVIYLSCWPTRELVELMGPRLLTQYGLEINTMSFIGFSLSTASVVALALFGECLILVIVIVSIGVHCALNINRCLKKNSMSSHTKRLHRQVFAMLLVEAACPTLFLQIPLVITCILLFTGTTSTQTLSYAVGVLLSSYNICCPIIIVVFMRDYRRYFLGLFRLRKIVPSSSGAHASERKTAPAQPKMEKE